MPPPAIGSRPLSSCWPSILRERSCLGTAMLPRLLTCAIFTTTWSCCAMQSPRPRQPGKPTRHWSIQCCRCCRRSTARTVPLRRRTSHPRFLLPVAGDSSKRFLRAISLKRRLSWRGQRECRLLWLIRIRTGHENNLTRLRKEFVEILRRLLPNLFFGDPAQLPDGFRGVHHKAGLVALSAMWHRRQIRRISLNQHAVKRDLLHGFTNIFCLGKADVAGKRNIEADI